MTPADQAKVYMLLVQAGETDLADAVGRQLAVVDPTAAALDRMQATLETDGRLNRWMGFVQSLLLAAMVFGVLRLNFSASFGGITVGVAQPGVPTAQVAPAPAPEPVLDPTPEPGQPQPTAL